MAKLSLKKLLLGSLLALQLTNIINDNSLSEVYAKEEQNLEDDKIYLEEDGKTLQLIGFKVNGYESIIFGYLYVKEDSIYLKDASDGRIYNLTKIGENYIQLSPIIHCTALQVLTEEQIARGYITNAEADTILSSFSIGKERLRVFAVSDYSEFDFYNFVNNNDINQPYSAWNTGTRRLEIWENTEDYDEKLALDNTPNNNYKLGILERYEEYPYYSNIYQTEPTGTTNEMGVIIKYYVLDSNNQKIATLNTQEEVDAFIIEHYNELDNYTWKAAYYNGTHIKDILDAIDNNEPISYVWATRFIDYKPVCKELAYN